MDSGADAKERLRIVQAFAPKANDKPEWVGTDKEINVLISTDVLSEGQNLQDCGYLVNYDLHWNPTRMVQRPAASTGSEPSSKRLDLQYVSRPGAGTFAGACRV